MTRRRRTVGEHPVGQEQSALRIVAIDHFAAVRFERLEYRQFAIAAAKHVEHAFKLRGRAMRTAVAYAALALKLSRGIDQRDVGTA